jgi:hypothetical protein
MFVYKERPQHWHLPINLDFFLWISILSQALEVDLRLNLSMTSLTVGYLLFLLTKSKINLLVASCFLVRNFCLLYVTCVGLIISFARMMAQPHT